MADPALRVAEVERFHNEREALAGRLTERWGEPYRLGLQTIRLRTAHEEMPEPWARLSILVGDVHLWELPEHGRWAALGVADLDQDDEVRAPPARHRNRPALTAPPQPRVSPARPPAAARTPPPSSPRSNAR